MFKSNSEIFINNIINKIISMTISKSFQLKIEKKIPDKCFDFVKESINNVMSSVYIFYDKEEEKNTTDANIIFESNIQPIKKDINNNSIYELELSNNKNDRILNSIFFNNTYSGENNWDLLEEPSSSNLDRYSTTLIKFKEKNLDFQSKYQIHQDKIVEEEDALENNENKEGLQKNEKQLDKKKLFVSKFSRIYNKNNDNKKKLTKIINQFEVFDIEPEKNYENQQIIKLRTIFERNKKEKEKEKESAKEEKDKIIFKQKLNEENFRKFMGKNINKDHNGEIIFIKGIKLNKLKKDFIISNTKYKTINNTISKPKKNEKSDILNNQKIDIDEPPPEEKDEINKKEKKNITKNIRLKLSPSVETNNKNIGIKPISLKKKIPLITSGSNFYLMNMEVGVSLMEDKKFKTGGLDFFNKYKKYSLQVYNKKLKEAEATNNLIKNIEILDEPKTKTIDEMTNLYNTNYIFGNSTFDGNNSSALHTDTNIFHKNSKNSMHSTNGNNSSIFKNYIKNANLSTYKPKNKSYINPFIKTKSGTSSLLNSIDKLNLKTVEGNTSTGKRKNIFREKMSKKVKEYMLKDINDFTKNLITDKNTEKSSQNILNTAGRIKGISHPGKPDMREIIQEIGLKGKIMRQRGKVFPPIKSNILEGEKFFKQ